MSSFEIEPGSGFAGELRVPGDKSISHRAVMLTAVARGTSRVQGLLRGTDVLATHNAFKAMGIQTEFQDGGSLTVRGAGRYGLRAPDGNLDLGNSGTAIRLLSGLLCGQRFGTRLVGDQSLNRRPMRRVTAPLMEMGANISTGPAGTPPLTIEPVDRLHGLRYRLPVASAQVKSALLLAGLYADDPVYVLEPAPLRDHTERMLKGMGAGIDVDGGWTRVTPGELEATDIQVPADFSSAAFFLVGAVISAQGEVALTDVGINPTRTGLLQVLSQMGADIRVEGERSMAGEPVADLIARSSSLKGIDVSPDIVPLAIDEFPAICVAAALAEGITRIRGAGELRHKESDRIHALALGLRALGVSVEETEDGMTIDGGEAFTGGTVDSFADHRVAMAFAIAGIRASASITVLNTDNVETSFPSFEEQARRLGLRLTRRG